MLKVASADLRRTPMDTLAVPLCSDRAIHNQRAISALLRRVAAVEEFKAEAGEELVLHRPKGTQIRQLVLLGLGKFEKLTVDGLRQATGQAVRRAMRKSYPEMCLALPAPSRLKMALRDAATAMLEGAALGNYLFDRFREEKKSKLLKSIWLLVRPADCAALEPLLREVEQVCRATHQARSWVNLPSNAKRPAELAQEFATVGKAAGLKASVLDEKALAKGGFGTLLAVAQGSVNPPRLVVLEWAPRRDTGTVVLVGKGVTFDSGGLNLKGSESLSDMKCDMAGAAAVAGAMLAAARLELGRRVVGIIPLVENMPSGTAMRPGDIVRSLSGKSVEINNTDAEGRLILADAISYAQKRFAPQVLIDAATLTGACMMALGEKIAGLFSPDERLAATILAAAARTGERCWRLPLPDDYRELIKSETADLSNMSSSRWGGAITAALFLSSFIGDTRWAHLDIAGPAFQKKENGTCPAGGTGFGVRLLWETLRSL